MPLTVWSSSDVGTAPTFTSKMGVTINRTGPHVAYTKPEMTDYLARRRIKRRKTS